MAQPRPDSEKAAECRRKAMEAHASADAAKDVFLRGSWLNIAASYRELADYLEPKPVLKLEL